KRVCIIGAGANGLATLKVLAETHQVQSGQWELVAFEERDKIGGIWYPAPASGDPPLTPLYDSLATNLPIPLMAYPSFLFPPGTSPFPTAAIVRKYLEDYATHFDLHRYVRLCTRVEKLFWDTGAEKWDVTLSTGERIEFDFVVVANGHYRKPRYPHVTGLQSWLDSGRAIHAAWYRRPSDFSHHKKVMVVGGGPSSLDICEDMMGVVPLLLHSVPGPTPKGGLAYHPDTDVYRKVDRVAEYQDEGSVLLVDGTTESNIDLVILATGYEISFPFLSHIKLGIPLVPPPLPDELYNSTYHVMPLGYQIFPLRGDFPPTSIAFTGLQYRAAPLPIFEVQAHVIARVLEDPESLDRFSCAVDIVARAHALIRDAGTDDALRIAKIWHRLTLLEPFEYRAQLNAFAGRKWTAPEWEIECWTKKHVIRERWKEIERSGKAEEWLKGVGENGMEDWIELCRKLINQSEPPASAKL
ncbi:FAD/NAD(P)-binding domain-containing protein, partial [Russula brevipes]